MAEERAKERLAVLQSKMKSWYDLKAEVHQFSPSDQVLVLLLLVSSPFQAKFHG